RGRRQPQGGAGGDRTGGGPVPPPRGGRPTHRGHPAADRGHEAAGPLGRRPQGGVPAAGAREGAAPGALREARIRTRRYRVRIGRYQLPNLPNPMSVNHSAKSSGFGGNGSPTRIRTSNLAVNSRPLYH